MGGGGLGWAGLGWASGTMACGGWEEKEGGVGRSRVGCDGKVGWEGEGGRRRRSAGAQSGLVICGNLAESDAASRLRIAAPGTSWSPVR